MAAKLGDRQRVLHCLEVPAQMFGRITEGIIADVIATTARLG